MLREFASLPRFHLRAAGLSVVCFIVALLGAPPISAETAPTNVRVFNTYLGPPFLIDESSGIAPALVRFLNKSLKGEYRFTLESMPRERLVRAHLSAGDAFADMVLLLAPPFVDDAIMTRYLWTRPLFKDFNVLVFRAGELPNVNSHAQLRGMTFARVRGSRYTQIDNMVAAGDLRLESTDTEKASLQMVASRRADFAQMNRLFFQFMNHELQEKLAAMAQPEVPSFERRILVGKANPALFARVDAALARLQCDAEWRQLAIKYAFEINSC